jgi:hypothetical protein
MRCIPAERSGCFRASIEGSCDKLRRVTHLLPALFVLFRVMGFCHDLIAMRRRRESPAHSSVSRVCLNFEAAEVIDNCLAPAIDVRPGAVAHAVPGTRYVDHVAASVRGRDTVVRLLIGVPSIRRLHNPAWSASFGLAWHRKSTSRRRTTPARSYLANAYSFKDSAGEQATTDELRELASTAGIEPATSAHASGALPAEKYPLSTPPATIC